MYLLSRNFTVLLFILFPFLSPAQNDENSLLWRISGKELAKPSYLFGTIHLNDRRLFKHDDSVFIALENAEGLAVEVDLGEFAAYYINKMLDEREDDKKLKDLYDERELKKFEKLAKKIGKNIRDITTKDILKEKNKWVSDYFEKGTMPTFLDAYLYSVAGKQRKWVGGIEDIQDQASILDKSDINVLAAGENDRDLETLLGLYISQDLKGINNAINQYDSLYKDILLVKRNIKMARRMDSLLQFRTMFFAVGAAHLPGKRGVIEELRDRGYNVEPVHSAKRIDADTYPFKTFETIWHDVTDDKGLYTTKMPGHPATLTIYDLVKMRYYADFGNLSGYMTMAVVHSSALESEEAMHAYARRVFHKDKFKPKKIISNGIDGLEYLEKSTNIYLRLRLFCKDNVLYVASASAKKQEGLQTSDMDHFFSSFLPQPLKIAAPQIYTTNNPIYGYTLNTPVPLSFNAKITNQNSADSTWTARVYSGQDDATGAYVMLIDKQVAPEIFIQSDSILLDEIYKILALKYPCTRIDTVIQGYNGVFANCESEDVHMKVLSVVRGNKNISIVLATDEKHKEDERLNTTLNSFLLQPYQRAQWQSRVYPDASLTAFTPAPIVKSDPGESASSEFYSFDSLTATTYIILPDTLNTYFWSDNDSAFICRKQQNYLDVDTFLSQTLVNRSGELSREVLYKMPQSSLYKRMKSTLHGNVVYHLSTIGEQSIVTNQDADSFFSTFKPGPLSAFDINTNKTVELIKALKTGDSLISAIACNALEIVTFTTSDLPQLHAAFIDTFPAGSHYDGFINYAIGRRISELEDTSTLAFIQRHYGATVNETRKQDMLAILAMIQTPESYKTLARVLADHPTSISGNYRLPFFIHDSLQLLQSVYNDFIPLLQDTGSGLLVASIANVLADTGMLSIETIRNSEATYISLAARLLPGYKEGKDWQWATYQLLEVLSKINTTASNEIIKNYTQVKDTFLKYKVAMLLAAKDLEVDANALKQIGANLATRSQLYTSLKEIHKEKLFPKEYLSQKLLAESGMFILANDEDETDKIELTQERTAVVNNVKYRFYLYKINYGIGEDASSYLGISGGYDLHGKNFLPVNEASGIYWEKQFDAANIDVYFAEYIANLEEAD